MNARSVVFEGRRTRLWCKVIGKVSSRRSSEKVEEKVVLVVVVVVKEE